MATNIFETAITIEDVSIVFDSMLEKRTVFGGRLITDYISKTSAEQRKGRTGRTREGMSYRMMTEESYTLLPNEKVEEIFQIDLSKIVMDLLKVSIDPLGVLPILVRSKLRPLVLNLKRLEFIKDDNTISEMGIFYTEFKLSLEAYAILWWLLNTTNELYYGLMTVSIINNIGRLWPQFDFGVNSSPTDFQATAREFRKTYYQKFIGRSDLHTYINMWREYHTFTGGQESPQSLTQWTELNKINTKNFSDANRTFGILTAQLPKYGYSIAPPSVSMSTDEIIDKLRPIIRKVYSESELINISKEKITYITSKSGDDKTSFSIAIIPRLNTYENNPPARIIPLSTRETAKGGKTVELSLSVDTFQLEDRLITDASLLAGYTVKIPGKSSTRGRAVLAGTRITLPKLPFAVDFTKIEDKPELYPRVAEQEYIQVGKSRKVGIL